MEATRAEVIILEVRRDDGSRLVQNFLRESTSRGVGEGEIGDAALEGTFILGMIHS